MSHDIACRITASPSFRTVFPRLRRSRSSPFVSVQRADSAFNIAASATPSKHFWSAIFHFIVRKMKSVKSEGKESVNEANMNSRRGIIPKRNPPSLILKKRGEIGYGQASRAPNSPVHAMKKPGGRGSLCTTGLVLQYSKVYCRGAKYPLRARTYSACRCNRDRWCGRRHPS